MEPTRRFVFHGNAVAIGGRIVRPLDKVVESTAASSLPVTGGRSQSQAQAHGDQFVRYGSASTFAEGLFDDPRLSDESAAFSVPPSALTTSTTVRAEVLDLTVGDTPRLSVQRLRAGLHSKHPGPGKQPSIVPHDDVAIDGVTVDDKYRLQVELSVVPFQRFGTHEGLRSASEDPGFVHEFGELVFKAREALESMLPNLGALFHGQHLIYATIVRRIHWDGEPFPGSRIERNVVTIPDFGTIYFGELLLAPEARRLTMARLQLGSPVGGSVACAEVENNGSWSP